MQYLLLVLGCLFLSVGKAQYKLYQVNGIEDNSYFVPIATVYAMKMVGVERLVF